MSFEGIGVLFGCFAREKDGDSWSGGLVIYQGYLFALKGHLCLEGSMEYTFSSTKGLPLGHFSPFRVSFIFRSRMNLCGVGGGGPPRRDGGSGNLFISNNSKAWAPGPGV